MVVRAFRRRIYYACTTILHQLPSQALKGCSREELQMLLEDYEEQQAELREARENMR